MSPRFMRRAVDLRDKCGFAFPVTSAARCPAYNAKVSSTGTGGPHTPLVVGDTPEALCHALDMTLYGAQAAQVLGLAAKYGVTGLGVKQRGEHARRFLHLDDLPQGEGRPRPWVWTY